MTTEDFEIEPGYRSSDYHSNKGQALSIVGEYEQALAWYDRALLLNPRYSDVWRYKGLTLKYMERYAEALECLQQAQALDPALKNVRSQIADVREKLGLLRYEFTENANSKQPVIIVEDCKSAHQMSTHELIPQKHRLRISWGWLLLASVSFAITMTVFIARIAHGN